MIPETPGIPGIPGRFMVVGDAGEPLGFVDRDRIDRAATIFMLALAANSDDSEALPAIATETLQREGPEGFGYVAAAAVKLMAENVVEPLLQVTDQTCSHDMRGGLRDAYENAVRTLGGDLR